MNSHQEMKFIALYTRREQTFIFRQILFNVVCIAFSRVQIKVGAWQYGFSITLNDEARQFV